MIREVKGRYKIRHRMKKKVRKAITTFPGVYTQNVASSNISYSSEYKDWRFEMGMRNSCCAGLHNDNIGRPRIFIVRMLIAD